MNLVFKEDVKMAEEIINKLICEELKVFRRIVKAGKAGLTAELANALDRAAAEEMAARGEKVGR